MRQQSSHGFLHWLVLAALLFSLNGCATGWGWGQDNKSASLQTVQDDLEYAQQKTKETTEALHDLVFADGADLPRAYRAFKDEVNTMNEAGARLVRHANGMHYQGNSYLVEAESSAGECRFPRLSKTAGMPRMELGDAFAPLAERGEQVQRAYRSFAFDVAAINKHLSRNLSERGVWDMELFFRRSEVDGESLSYALDQALAAVKRAKTEYGNTAQGKGQSVTPR